MSTDTTATMTTLHIAVVKVSIRLRVPNRALMQLLPASPESLGNTLARQVHQSITQSGLGYYPPLEFIRSQNLVAPYLVDAIEQVAEASQQYLRQHLDELLAPVFSNVSVRSIHFPAFALPPIRVTQTNALAQLAQHYVPSAMKCELEVSIIRKQKSEAGLQRFVANTITRWFSEVFDDLAVTT